MAPSPRTRDDPAVRRTQILDQAIRVIGERGYFGFTVQDLAKACGLSNAGLLHHFPSKEQLFLAVLQKLEAGEAEFMEPLVAAAQQQAHLGGAVSAMREVVRTIVARSIAQPQLLRFFAALQVESLNPLHPAHDWWRRRERVTTELFAKLLSAHVEEPASAGRQLLAMMDGLCLRWLWADQAFDLLPVVESAFAKLIAAPPVQR